MDSQRVGHISLNLLTFYKNVYEAVDSYENYDII